MLELPLGDLDSALRALLLAGLALWTSWWTLAVVVALLDPRLAARWGPPVLRSLLIAGAVAATATPAHAARSAPPSGLEGLPFPQRPPTSTAPSQAGPDEPEPPPRGHTVSSGDCLWSIVRDRSPGAAPARIASEVADWYAANRDVIGSDPDLLRPGQHLVPPGES